MGPGEYLYRVLSFGSVLPFKSLQAFAETGRELFEQFLGGAVDNANGVGGEQYLAENQPDA